MLRSRLPSVGTATTALFGKMILGLGIMIIGVYFFLLDGQAMIESIKGLSPLDDLHEQELIDEFAKVSRAVMVAMLLSALVQGLLAGIGFYIAGVESVFLLTLLTACLSLVPFVGAAAVWVPVSLWLYFFDNNLLAAILLAVYGVTVISMADNIIKPLVLHGQSNLHPLLALLSVLGGVAALGPIGLLVGPMIVAFLQVALNILRREITVFEANSSSGAVRTNHWGQRQRG
jgi:predicted PurR-regulated permease PerM